MIRCGRVAAQWVSVLLRLPIAPESGLLSSSRALIIIFGYLDFGELDIWIFGKWNDGDGDQISASQVRPPWQLVGTVHSQCEAPWEKIVLESFEEILLWRILFKLVLLVPGMCPLPVSTHVVHVICTGPHQTLGLCVISQSRWIVKMWPWILSLSSLKYKWSKLIPFPIGRSGNISLSELSIYQSLLTQKIWMKKWSFKLVYLVKCFPRSHVAPINLNYKDALSLWGIKG